MAEHLTEEEQVEALKRWWDDNWLSVVAPILIVLGGYLGWNFYNNYTEDQAKAASAQYQDLLKIVEVAPGEELSEDKKLNAVDLASSIAESYPNGMYGNLSTLLLAKFAVEEGELSKAEGLIREISENGVNASIVELAKTRLARVLAAQKKYEEALSAIAVSGADAYKSLIAEIRGDIYVAQGKLALARTAYQEALDSLGMEQFARRGLVQVKFESTATPAEEESAEDPAEPEGDA